jgi:hypothetical protein
VVKTVKIKKNNLGLVGEMLTAGKLLRMNHDVSITFGMTKKLDVLYHDPKTGRTGQMQSSPHNRTLRIY